MALTEHEKLVVATLVAGHRQASNGPIGEIKDWFEDYLKNLEVFETTKQNLEDAPALEWWRALKLDQRGELKSTYTAELRDKDPNDTSWRKGVPEEVVMRNYYPKREFLSGLGFISFSD